MTTPAPTTAETARGEPSCAPPARSTRPRFLLLVADPDPATADNLRELLGGHQIDVVTALDAADALLQAGIHLPDAVLTAAQLPPMTGTAITAALHRRTCVPTLVGLGGDDGGQATTALAAGATACIARPYRLAELLPLLRSIRPDTAADFGAPLQVGALRVDPAAMQVHLHGTPVSLPMREFALLHLLASHEGRVVTRQQIVRLLWNGDEGSNTVNVHIRRLRAHLGDDLQNPAIIVTVRGMGYRLIAPGSP